MLKGPAETAESAGWRKMGRAAEAAGRKRDLAAVLGLGKKDAEAETVGRVALAIGRRRGRRERHPPSAGLGLLRHGGLVVPLS